jgi:hypothetical protein
MSSLDWSLATAEVAGGRRETVREATADELVGVAADLGLLGCTKLVAHYTLNPIGKGRYKFVGRCEASVFQACGVTMKPVPDNLVLSYDVEFHPDAVDAPPGDENDEAEVLSLPEIEPIPHGRLEIGRVIFETLASGLNPYPRLPEAAFDWRDPVAASSPANPFAVLAKLKPKL